MNDKTLSLIIPTYNEKENIVALLDEIRKYLDLSTNEILVVDDGSPDGTARLAEAYAAGTPGIRVINRSGERGLSLSVIDGFKAARGKYFGVIDGDLSHDPALLPGLIAAVTSGAGIAIGSRRVPGGGADHWPAHRRFTSWIATMLARLWIHADVQDPMSGFFVVRRDVVERVLGTLNPKGYKILLEIVARSQEPDCRELPFIFKDRTQGHSKLTGHVSRQYLQMLWDLRAFSRLSFLRRPR